MKSTAKERHDKTETLGFFLEFICGQIIARFLLCEEENQCAFFGYEICRSDYSNFITSKITYNYIIIIIIAFIIY